MKLKAIVGSLLMCASAVNATNVACVGNSITYGYGLPYGTSYPNFLQSLLGEDYVVSNFGVSGMTFAKSGNQSYWSQAKCSEALSSNPDLVVVELGTNDSKFFFGNYPDQGVYNYLYGAVGVEELRRDYRALIDTFAYLDSKPEIWTTLQPYSNNVTWTITDTAIVNVINPIIFDAAVEKGVNIIDLHTHFCTPSWFLDDSVHPNESGAMELAKIVNNYISMEKPQIVQNGNILSVEGGCDFFWYKDGMLVDGARENALMVEQNGVYKALVQVDASNKSYLLTNELQVDATGSSMPGSAEKFVYADGVFYVPQYYVGGDTRLRVYDMNGRLVKSCPVVGDKTPLALPSHAHVVVVEYKGGNVYSVLVNN